MSSNRYGAQEEAGKSDEMANEELNNKRKYRFLPHPLFKQLPRDFQALLSGRAGQIFFYHYRHIDV